MIMTEVFNPFSLSGKTILVTGASSGIGRGIAEACAKMGATIVLTGRNEERLAATAEALVGNGHKSIIVDLALIGERQILPVQITKIDSNILWPSPNISYSFCHIMYSSNGRYKLGNYTIPTY